MPDRPYTDTDWQTVAPVIRREVTALSGCQCAGAECDRCDPDAADTTRAVLDALTAAGWVPGERITAALADLRETELRCRHMHDSDCLCGTVAARLRATLTGKDT